MTKNNITAKTKATFQDQTFRLLAHTLIAGPNASGKTMLGSELKNKLNNTLIITPWDNVKYVNLEPKQQDFMATIHDKYNFPDDSLSYSDGHKQIERIMIACLTCDKPLLFLDDIETHLSLQVTTTLLDDMFSAKKLNPNKNYHFYITTHHPLIYKAAENKSFQSIQLPYPAESKQSTFQLEIKQ